MISKPNQEKNIPYCNECEKIIVKIEGCNKYWES